MEKTIHKKSIAIITAMSSFLPPFMSSTMNVALPSIGSEFSIGSITLNWITTSYLLAAAVVLVPFGKFADIIGRKRIFSIGLLIFTISSFLISCSWSSTALIIFRIIQGISSSMIFGTAGAILISIIPPAERGKFIGINVASVYVGLSIGPVLGGIITENLGWRGIFYISSALSLFTFILLILKIKGEWKAAEGERLDFVGSFLYGLFLIGIMIGFSTLSGIFGIFLIIIGIVGFSFFIIWELRAEYPLINLRLFRNNRMFSFSNLAALINYSATFSVGFLLSLYLQNVKGLGPQNTGFVLLSQPIMQVIISPIAGRLSDKFESRTITSTGITFTMVGLIMLSFLDVKTSITYIITALVILGISFGLFSSPNTNAIMSSVDKRYFGVASGMVGTMRLLGQTFSMGIVMLIFSLNIGSKQITPEIIAPFINSIKISLLIFIMLCMIGIYASLARGRNREGEPLGNA
ncbi:MAG: MFS transporter [Promethearchaeota archaeon]